MSVMSVYERYVKKSLRKGEDH